MFPVPHSNKKQNQQHVAFAVWLRNRRQSNGRNVSSYENKKTLIKFQVLTRKTQVYEYLKFARTLQETGMAGEISTLAHTVYVCLYRFFVHKFY